MKLRPVHVDVHVHLDLERAERQARLLWYFRTTGVRRFVRAVLRSGAKVEITDRALVGSPSLQACPCGCNSPCSARLVIHPEDWHRAGGDYWLEHRALAERLQSLQDRLDALGGK